VPRLPRASSFIARLDAGHTVALDDPIAAAWFAGKPPPVDALIIGSIDQDRRTTAETEGQ